MSTSFMYPPQPSNIGNKGTRVNPDEQEKHFTIMDEIVHEQSTAAHKLLCLQRIEYEETHEQELRFGY